MTDPFDLFRDWYDEARSAEINDSNAMALATADAEGRPSVRMVLLKGFDPRGFVFYTNQEGRKAGDLAANPNAALLFHWKSLRRQIRIEGRVTHVSDEEADAYFASRSRDSQLGAWASDQSRPLDARTTFERRFDEVQRRFEEGNVPRPPHWGGYKVKPVVVEYWQGRPSRLHDRIQYTLEEGGNWKIERLAP